MHHIFYSKLHLCIVTRAWPNLIKLRAPQDAKATQKTHPSTICNFQFIHRRLAQQLIDSDAELLQNYDFYEKNFTFIFDARPCRSYGGMFTAGSLEP